MQVRITMVEIEIRTAIAEYINRTYGVIVVPNNLFVEVKSKQNYKSEWEHADIRVDASLSARGADE